MLHKVCGNETSWNLTEELPHCSDCNVVIFDETDILLNNARIVKGNNDVVTSGKGAPQMLSIDKYVDRCLIDEYATRDCDGLHLDIDDLPKHEISNFLDFMMSKDSAIKDLVMYHMQEAINKRLSYVEWRAA